MDEEVSSVQIQEVAEPVITETVESTNEPVNAGSEEITPSQVEEKPVQSAEDNAKYASIRREAEQKAESKAQELAQKKIDAHYEREYGASHGIHSEADFLRVKAQQDREAQIQREAEKQGISEDLARRMLDLEENNKSTAKEKATYQRQLNLIKEDATLRKDETFSDYYSEYEADIKERAEKFNVDYTTAMLLSIKDNFKAIKDGTAKKVQQDTINSIIKNGKSSVGPVASSQNPASNSVADMSDAEFKAYTQRALNGELRKK